MDVLTTLYRERDLPVIEIDMEGRDIFHKIFSTLVLGDWISYYIAIMYDVEPEQVPIVEEFKKLVASHDRYGRDRC
jgi:glucose/mannose-6-phosphate isomerase